MKDARPLERSIVLLVMVLRSNRILAVSRLVIGTDETSVEEMRRESRVLMICILKI